MKTYHGSCLCQQVTYSVTGFSDSVANCHCTMCRKFHGAAFGTLVGVQGLQWLSGKSLLNEYTAQNGTVRTFCSHCGASLGFRIKNAPFEEIELAVATFDEEIPIRVTAQIYTKYKANWCELNHAVLAFEEGRNSTELTLPQPRESIFKTPEFYPAFPLDDKVLLEHYHEFDHVFLGFLPFISFPKDFVSEDEVYPTDDEIQQYGQAVSWQEIINKTQLNNHKELFNATATNLNFYREEFQIPRLAKRLTEYVTANNLYYPDEGCFGYFIKREIYDLFKDKNLWHITIDEQFYSERKALNLNFMSREEFIDTLEPKFKNIHIHNNKEKILFAISFDDLTFTCAFTENSLTKKDIDNTFEGFWANSKTTHLWALNKDQIE